MGEYNDSHEYDDPGKQKNNQGATVLDWAERFILPIILAVIAASALTVSFAINVCSGNQNCGWFSSVLEAAPPETETLQSPTDDIEVMSETPQGELVASLPPPSPTPEPSITQLPTLTPTLTTATNCSPVSTQSNMPATSTYPLSVQPNEFHIWSSGRITVHLGQNDNGEPLASDLDEGYKGFISVFLPDDNQTTDYYLSNVNPTFNYHAVYQNCSAQQMMAQIQRDAANQARNGCSSGCDEVYIRIFEGDSATEELYEPSVSSD